MGLEAPPSVKSGLIKSAKGPSGHCFNKAIRGWVVINKPAKMIKTSYKGCKVQRWLKRHARGVILKLRPIHTKRAKPFSNSVNQRGGQDHKKLQKIGVP